MKTKMKDLKLPSSFDCEKTVLGCLIIDEKLREKCKLIPEDFFEDHHKLIYEGMLYSYKNTQSIDMTLINAFTEKKGLSVVGYLNECAKNTLSVKNFESYVKVIKENSNLREVIRLACEEDLEAVKGFIKMLEDNNASNS